MTQAGIRYEPPGGYDWVSDNFVPASRTLLSRLKAAVSERPFFPIVDRLDDDGLFGTLFEAVMTVDDYELDGVRRQRRHEILVPYLKDLAPRPGGLRSLYYALHRLALNIDTSVNDTSLSWVSEHPRLERVCRPEGTFSPEVAENVLAEISRSLCAASADRRLVMLGAPTRTWIDVSEADRALARRLKEFGRLVHLTHNDREDLWEGACLLSILAVDVGHPRPESGQKRRRR